MLKHEEEFKDLVERVREIDPKAGEYLESRRVSLSGDLREVIIFSKTPQGHDYWWDIYGKL
jgi:hypothetical protein